LAAQPLIRRWGNRAAVVGSLILVGTGSALIAAAPAWPIVLVGAIVAGLGLGGCDALITQLLILGMGQRGPSLVNIAHACFGIGTVASPAVIAIIGAKLYPIVFTMVSACAVVALFTMKGLASHPTPAESTTTKLPKSAKSAKSLNSAHTAAIVVGGLLVLYIAHFAVQSGIGNWEPTRLIDLGYSESTAGLATSGYWLAMVIGRFIVAPFAQKIQPSTIVTISALGMTVALLFTLWPGATMWGYLLTGLFLGPIFPNGLTWLSRTGYATGSTFAYVIAGAMAGAVVCPPLIGALIGTYGTSVLTPALLAGAFVTVVSAVVVHSTTTYRSGRPEV